MQRSQILKLRERERESERRKKEHNQEFVCTMPKNGEKKTTSLGIEFRNSFFLLKEKSDLRVYCALARTFVWPLQIFGDSQKQINSIPKEGFIPVWYIGIWNVPTLTDGYSRGLHYHVQRMNITWGERAVFLARSRKKYSFFLFLSWSYVIHISQYS